MKSQSRKQIIDSLKSKADFIKPKEYEGCSVSEDKNEGFFEVVGFEDASSVAKLRNHRVAGHLSRDTVRSINVGYYLQVVGAKMDIQSWIFSRNQVIA